MIRSLDKACTGFRCEQKDRCKLFRKGDNPFNYISPLSFHDECPYHIPTGSSDDDAND